MLHLPGVFAKELMKNRKAFKGYNEFSLVGSVLLYKYFVTITFFVGKYMKCQLMFGHKIMIGTVDSYTTLWHILH